MNASAASSSRAPHRPGSRIHAIVEAAEGLVAAREALYREPRAPDAETNYLLAMDRLYLAVIEGAGT